MHKNKSLYLILTIAAILLITIIIVVFNSIPGYKLQLLNTFVIPDLKQSNKDQALFAASDTTLYILNTMDSTKTKSYAFSFDGKQNKYFYLPPDSLYHQCVFDYLWSSSQLYLNGWDNVHNVDFYTPLGKPIYRKPSAYKCVYVNLTDWKGDLYYSILNDSQGLKKETLGLYKESPDGKRKLLQILNRGKHQDVSSGFIFPIRLMVSSNGNTMAMAYVVKHFIKIRFFSVKKEHQFKIFRGINFLTWTYIDFAPWNMFTGSNYIVLTKWQLGERLRKAAKTHQLAITVTDDDMYKIDKVYNLYGRCLGILECDDKNSHLVEISNDKMIFFNNWTGRVRVYKITVK